MKLLTIPRAAAEFGFPYETLLRLVNEKLVPSYDIPGRRSRLLDPRDVQAFLDRVKTGSDPGTETQGQSSEVAPNKERQTRAKSGKSTDKYSWMNQFRRKRASCS